MTGMPGVRRTIVFLLGAAALATVVGSTFGARAAGASTFNVTSTADMGPNTLRDAMTMAAGNPGPDDVVIQPGLGTITLASLITYGAGANGDVTIRGNGATVALNMAGNALNNQSNFTMTIDGLVVTRSPAGFDLVNTNFSPLNLVNSYVSGGGVNTASGAL